MSTVIYFYIYSPHLFSIYFISYIHFILSILNPTFILSPYLFHPLCFLLPNVYFLVCLFLILLNLWGDYNIPFIQIHQSRIVIYLLRSQGYLSVISDIIIFRISFVDNRAKKR